MNKRSYAALALLALFLAIPIYGVSAAASSNGPTNPVMGMPVSISIRGATASTAYEVICITGSNYTVIESITSDSSGYFQFTVNYYYGYGQNSYVVRLDAAGADLLTFNIDNMDIVPYLVILITVSILFGIMRMFGGRKGGFL